MFKIIIIILCRVFYLQAFRKIQNRINSASWFETKTIILIITYTTIIIMSIKTLNIMGIMNIIMIASRCASWLPFVWGWWLPPIYSTCSTRARWPILYDDKGCLGFQNIPEIHNFLMAKAASIMRKIMMIISIIIIRWGYLTTSGWRSTTRTCCSTTPTTGSSQPATLAGSSPSLCIRKIMMIIDIDVKCFSIEMMMIYNNCYPYVTPSCDNPGTLASQARTRRKEWNAWNGSSRQFNMLITLNYVDHTDLSWSYLFMLITQI